MRPEALVITTYPGHFYLTATTIQSYLKHNQSLPIVVIADDLSEWAWPSYAYDCATTYGCEIVSARTLQKLHKFAHAPWYRQQMIKLHLDQILPFDSWLSVDGDIVFVEPLRVLADYYTHSPGGDIQKKQNAYVSRVLGLDKVGIWAYGQQLCMSNPPIKHLNKNLLIQLRDHVQKLHQTDMFDLHLTLMGHEYSVSEWELIENFKCHVLQKDLQLVKYNTHLIGNSQQTRPKHCCLTCYSTDQEIGLGWFERQGIAVSDTIWQRLTEITR